MFDQPKILHVTAGIMFFILAIVTLRVFLFGDSLFLYRDVVWPSNTDQFSQIFYTLDLESIRRSIFLGPLFSLTEILGLSSLDVQKLLFIFFRFFAGYFAYIIMYNLLSSKINNPNRKILFAISLFAGFFYAYNPIVTMTVAPTLFFAFSYPLTILIFYFFDKSLNQKSFRNILITSVLFTLSVAGTIQFLVLLPIFVLVPWLIIVCIRRKMERKNLFVPIGSSILVGLFFIGISSYWILPTLSEASKGTGLKPEYILTYDTLEVLSKDTTLINNFRLMGDFWPRISLEPKIIDPSIWTIMSFLIPISILIFILFSKRFKLRFYFISLLLVSLLVLYFHQGQQDPIASFYVLLYEIPIIGWMFRVPDKFAMILAFYFTLILSLGFYNLLDVRKNKKIKQYFGYASLFGFILCVSLIVWPMFTGDFGGIVQKIIANPGKNFTKPDFQINLASQNLAIFGSSDKFKWFEETGINTTELSLLSMDTNIGRNLKDVMGGIDKIVVEDRGSIMMQLLPKDSITIQPFDATLRYKPENFWSRSSTDDPLYGKFHTYLEKEFDITNSFVDYGKGLVFTNAKDTLEIPFEIDRSDKYDVYIRYMKSQYGGETGIYLNNNAVQTIETLDQINKFVWSNLGSYDLSVGKNSFTLKNLGGLNAVNILVLIPSDQSESLIKQVNNIATEKRNIYLLDAKNDFYTDYYWLSLNKSKEGKELLVPNTSVSANIDLLKNSQYTIAIKVKSCESCSSFTLNVGEGHKVFPLKDNKTEDTWFYYTTNLDAGKTGLNIEGQAYLDSVAIYSDSHVNETLEDILAPVQNNILSEYEELNPTKYRISVNATQPFVMKFNAEYNPLWQVHLQGKIFKSVPLFDSTGPTVKGFQIDDNENVRNYVTNGFVISKSGNLDMVMEYLPQRWYYVGAIITAIISIASVGYFISKRILILSLIYRIAFYLRHIVDFIQGKTIAMEKFQHTVPPLKNTVEQDIEEQDSGTQTKSEKKFLNSIIGNLSSVPIFLALILLVQCMMTLLLVSEKPVANSTVNTLIIFVYFLLIVGVLWKFIQYLKKR